MPPPVVDPHDPNAISAANWEDYPGSSSGQNGRGSGGGSDDDHDDNRNAGGSSPEPRTQPESEHHKLHKRRQEHYTPTKIPPPPIRMLTRCFYGTLMLALLGFVFALLGVTVYAWAALKEPVGIVAASCVGIGVTTGIVVLIW